MVIDLCTRCGSRSVEPFTCYCQFTVQPLLAIPRDLHAYRTMCIDMPCSSGLKYYRAIQPESANIKIVLPVGRLRSRRTPPASTPLFARLYAESRRPHWILVAVRGCRRSGNLRLQIKGSNFVREAVVRLNGTTRETVYVSATELVADVPAADLAKTGLLAIAVANPAPGGGNSTSLDLTVK